MNFEELVFSGAKSFGLELSNEQISDFSIYKDSLFEWNSRMNLTSITEESDVAIKHYLDSLSVFKAVKPEIGSSFIDIGTGAGFPGIPLKIIRRDMGGVLLDSLSKRIKFLDEIIEKLNLDHLTSVSLRAEDGGKSPKYREKFDFCFSRAVAKLNVLSEYCLPYVKVGGCFVAMKGSEIDELSDAKAAIAVLGGEIVNIVSFTLPHSDFKRNLIVVRKYKDTPHKYPRNQGQINKSPIK